MKNQFFIVFFLGALSLFVLGCESPNSSNDQLVHAGLIEKQIGSSGVEGGMNSAILNRELALARASTAKYHNIQNALDDGYVDINLYIPQMGWHFLNQSYLDENFEIDKPELLVYAEKPGGGYRLVAVEYAAPLTLQNPPAGFTGDEDVWHENSGAGLWTLHAWIWLNNPNGVFADFNPRVP